MTTAQLVIMITLGILSTYVFFKQNFLLMKYLPPEKTPSENYWFMGGFVCLLILFALLWATVSENNRLTSKNPCPQYEPVKEQFYRIKQ